MIVVLNVKFNIQPVAGFNCNKIVKILHINFDNTRENNEFYHGK